MRGDTIIGVFKLVKAATLLALSATGISLLNFKIRGELLHRITLLSGDAHFRVLTRVAKFIGFETNGKLILMSIGAFLYAALFATEGIGLLMEARWAEYFTVIATASFVPIEIYELIRRFDAFKLGILAVNVGILIYLIWRLQNR
ncbi:MAG TPA: DUF2127 domain-containing protein [Candidatus Kapabacteria bacterium]|jgi:uncharacterized membrane protein (DUF2068 family)